MDEFERLLLEYVVSIGAPQLAVGILAVFVLALAVAAVATMIRMPAAIPRAFPTITRRATAAIKPVITRIPIAAPRARAPSVVELTRA